MTHLGDQEGPEPAAIIKSITLSVRQEKSTNLSPNLDKNCSVKDTVFEGGRGDVHPTLLHLGSTARGWGGGPHVVVVVRGGSGAQNLIVALQEGLEAALKPLELLKHLDVLRRGRVAVGNPQEAGSQGSAQIPNLTTSALSFPSLPGSWPNPSPNQQSFCSLTPPREDGERNINYRQPVHPTTCTHDSKKMNSNEQTGPV